MQDEFTFQSNFGTPTKRSEMFLSELYDVIENLCKKNGVSITQMCREGGISRAPLSDLKMGRTKNLSTETLSKIAVYFGVSMDYLLGKDEKLVEGESDELNEYLETLKNRPEMKMLFSVAKGATKKDIEKAVKIIEALQK